MKILVRLPNWLGDLVMSTGFIHQLQQFYPGASISVIAKKGIHDLLQYFPSFEHQFIFNKNEYKGIKGLWKFGKEIQKTDQFDLFFSLPDSFSSAIIGWASGAKKRIGFKKEMRGLVMTHTYTKPGHLHRVEEYIALLEMFTGKKAITPNVSLHHNFQKKQYVVVNINSEASSRRLTVPKAVEELKLLRKNIKHPIYLIGAPKEKPFIDEVLNKLENKSNIENVAGKTNLPQLVELLASAQLMLTTDSGPAHLANALGTNTIVLFGAGNEANTAPYNAKLLTGIRLGKLSCEPCVKNVCKLYKVPQCMQQLDMEMIISKVVKQLNP
ncbi:glycosyltransferase family 9 protein [Chitinophagaceae bacterium LB-8]|uniref:Glycosyltransferase family 9 protein n=1 Tax=Paraflavisolibacter caeni TaxID=2982496 RepID=A0A9X2XWF3_9BACT|nr:glycosyltransferase family 9 protein [Paraflavisolibacter caeni]MCU7548958.1 glycosyltransferase family 9 protein [Paraflavisolibacter caeni]